MQSRARAMARRDRVKNITTFLLVLISTMFIVIIISFASTVSANADQSYSFSADVNPGTEISAGAVSEMVPKDDANMPLAMTVALIAAVPVSFFICVLRGNCHRPRRSYATSRCVKNYKLK